LAAHRNAMGLRGLKPALGKFLNVVAEAPTRKG